jgi:hypothetical protein
VASIYAPLISPTFTGSPTVPGYLTTATAGTTYAPLSSPTLTGIPAAPTGSAGTNTTQIATTAFDTAAVGVETARATAAEALKAPLASPTFTGSVTIPGGSVNSTTIGGTTPAAGTFTTLGATGAATFSGGITGTLTGGASLDLPLAGGTMTGTITNGTLSGTVAGAATVTATATDGSTPTGSLASWISSAAGNGYAVGPGSIALASGGTGYVVGEIVTLSCSGATFVTPPRVVVTAVSSGAVTGSTLTVPGVATIAPSATCGLMQASTTGIGTGAAWTGKFSVIASSMSFASLTTGGSVSNNGNLFIGAEQPNAGYSGAESTFVGDRCGGNIVNGSENSCFGHDAMGVFGGTNLIASGSSFFGGDAARNYGGGTGQSGFGASSCRSLSGNYTSCFGYQAGQNITSGANNLVAGYNVAPTLTTGNYNLIIGLDSTTDVPTASTSDYLNILNVLTVTGTNVPSTSVALFGGSLNAATGIGVVNGDMHATASAAETHVKLTNFSSTGRDYWLTSGGVAGTFSGGKFGLWDNTGGTWDWMSDASGNFTARGAMTASGSVTSGSGVLTTGAYGGTFSDGVGMDYVSGTARFWAGTGDGFAWYAGGNGGAQLGALSTGGALTVASIGTTAYTSSSIGGSALLAGACASTTVSITGLTTAMTLITTPVTYPGDGTFWHAYASAAGTATVKVCESVAGTPTASTYNIRVIQ